MRCHLILTVVLTACLTGCEGFSTDVQQTEGVDWTHMQTYSWAQLPPDEDFIASMVVSTIEKNLQDRGYRKAATGDFVVAFEGRSSGTMHTKTRWTITGPQQAQSGTLQITAHDARSRQLIWRGVSEASFSVDRNERERGEKLVEVLDALMAEFPAR